MGQVSWQTLLPLIVFVVLIIVLFWTTVLRPQVRAQRKHEKLIDSLKVGDQIVTAGGIYGKITELTEDTLTLEVAPQVRITFDRRAARRRLG